MLGSRDDRLTNQTHLSPLSRVKASLIVLITYFRSTRSRAFRDRNFRSLKQVFRSLISFCDRLETEIQAVSKTLVANPIQRPTAKLPSPIETEFRDRKISVSNRVQEKIGLNLRPIQRPNSFGLYQRPDIFGLYQRPTLSVSIRDQKLFSVSNRDRNLNLVST